MEGTYDDAVDEAAAAVRGEGLLVPDTTSELHCAAVQHVMRGYSTITNELPAQLADRAVRLTHSFVQAGVGGLAAAVADGRRAGKKGSSRMIVVEPDAAACVGWALKSGKLERVPGDLITSAEMLSCGRASAPAVETLRRRGARAVTVSEAQLHDAMHMFQESGIETSPSGGAGLAGLLKVANDPGLRRAHGLGRDSAILLIVTESAK